MSLAITARLCEDAPCPLHPGGAETWPSGRCRSVESVSPHRLMAVTFELLDSGCALETVNGMGMLLVLFPKDKKTRCSCKEAKSFQSREVPEVGTQRAERLVSQLGTHPELITRWHKMLLTLLLKAVGLRHHMSVQVCLSRQLFL